MVTKYPVKRFKQPGRRETIYRQVWLETYIVTISTDGMMVQSTGFSYVPWEIKYDYKRVPEMEDSELEELARQAIKSLD